MLAGLSDVWKTAGQHQIFLLTTAGLAGWLGIAWQQARCQAIKRRRERRVREEIEAYSYLDTRLGPGQDLAGFSRSVCQIIAEKSPFQRAALLVRNAGGTLEVTGSYGTEESLLKALSHWAAGMTEPVPAVEAPAPQLRSILGQGIDVGGRSRAVVLGEQHGRVIIVPFATTGNRRLMGAIVVGANSMLSAPRRFVDEALAPLEMLAIKLGRAMENLALAERLLRAEKLAGLGLLAGGVAHALNNPLTAVLGFAELIAETAVQPRVQQDAETIVHEAQRMRDTVESLLNIWRPSINREEDVNMAELLLELAVACKQKLETRGVQLIIEAAEDAPTVRGKRDRLRQVMEHLLNNAAQAIATRPVTAADKTHAIRLTLTHDARSVQVIVSDTGPGFREPTRIFDPFYTTREPGEGAGLGLSICYGIVCEHNGEIAAFNLHPHGAAVMIELPAGPQLAAASETFLGEAA